MKKWFNKYGGLIGINPFKAINFCRKLPQYYRDWKTLKADADEHLIPFPGIKFYPCLHDKAMRGGKASGHYFHQDLLVAQKINYHNPKRHIDVGSRIDGFVAHVASFRKIEVADIRDINSGIKNIASFKLDILKPLPENLIECTDSLSCLHVIEHFGLGRYGDKIQWDGHVRGFYNLTKILKKSGRFYISTPIGPQRIEFNAHRVFAVKTLLDLFSKDFIIENFSYVDDSGTLHKDRVLSKEQIEDNFGCNYGCGIFQLKKM